MVVLHEVARDAGYLGEGPGIEAFEEETTLITEHAGFEDEDIRNIGRNGFHAFSPAMLNRYWP
ncbi:hypothetical protein D9M70_641840 [compost metagenome]